MKLNELKVSLTVEKTRLFDVIKIGNVCETDSWDVLQLFMFPWQQFSGENIHVLSADIFCCKW